MRVRPARLEDAAAIAVVHTTAWQETYSDFVPPLWFNEDARRRREAMWRRILTQADPETQVLVAQPSHADSLVGFACAQPTRIGEGEQAVRERELATLYVLADWHGQGVGSALLTAALGQESAQLWVAQNNARARSFYERHGFQADGARRVETGLESLAEIRMVR